MHVPSGRIQPGTAFYQALQGLQRPQGGAEATAQRAVRAGDATTQTASGQGAERSGTAARAKPTEASAREAEPTHARRDLPRGSLLDVKI